MTHIPGENDGSAELDEQQLTPPATYTDAPPIDGPSEQDRDDDDA